MAKVLVGMSGGVDSSVTVHLLLEQGFEVEGLSFILWEARNKSSYTTCCSLEAVDSAAQTAAKLGIRHTAVDVRNEFIEKVVEPFVEAYTKGMTPNPCILCNKHIKFPFLLREAEKRGAEYIATGHYAKVVQGSEFPDSSRATRRPLLLKGVDPKKDQSYFLYVLGQDALERLLLPLGDYRKEDIRTIARSLNLTAADRPESQEICFIEDKNYFQFIEKLSPVAGGPGPILDTKGKLVGTHKGIYCYTIGQRKGLNVSSLDPHYVIKIDTLRNTLYVGLREAAKIRGTFVDDVNWILVPAESRFYATVKVRSMMEARPASVEILPDGVMVLFDEPQWAPAPGQSAVFYDGDRVIGGGVIRERVQLDGK
jgi:tRNA-uridine 2-sulfurtransferase